MSAARARTIFRLSWFLLACLLSLPLFSSAQTPELNFAVSVRELSIPVKAHRAFRQGVDLLEKRDPASSLPHFQRAISEYANYYEAYYKMGVAELKLWRTTEAEQAFRQSIELSHRQYAEPLLALCAVLGYRGKFVEAEEVSRRGLELDPTVWSGYYSRAWALFNLDRLEDAEKTLREALRLKSDSPEVYLLLADVHHRQHDYRAVLDDLNEYLKLEPDHGVNSGVQSLRDEAERAIGESLSATSHVQSQP
jgi:tetratricopeptide (TPR) repeat protein